MKTNWLGPTLSFQCFRPTVRWEDLYRSCVFTRSKAYPLLAVATHLSQKHKVGYIFSSNTWQERLSKELKSASIQITFFWAVLNRSSSVSLLSFFSSSCCWRLSWPRRKKRKSLKRREEKRRTEHSRRGWVRPVWVVGVSCKRGAIT